MAKLPLEPCFSKSLFAAKIIGRSCEKDMTILLSMLSTENIWLGVTKHDEKRLKSQNEARRKFGDPKSDHMTLIDIYDAWYSKLRQGGQ